MEGLSIIQPKIFEDSRGYFMESYKETFIEKNFSNIRFIQDNESRSARGVLRGLHFQKKPFEQTKLVRAVKGEILDVAVDLRPKSPTFGRYETFILTGTNKKQLLIPKGFAHGFLVLSEEAIVNYKVDQEYNPNAEYGIKYNDTSLKINWGLNSSDLIISKKDLMLDSFKILLKNGIFN